MQIILYSFISFLFVATPLAHAQGMTNGFGSIYSGDNADVTNIVNGATNSSNMSSSDNAVTSSSDTGNDTSDQDTGGTNISTTDAQGNLTINANEDYPSAIDLNQGNLTVDSGATTKSIHVRNGSITLKSDSEVTGSITVDNGNLTIGSNATVNGNIEVNGILTVKDNVDITGSISTGSSGTIMLGSNVDIKGTITSAAGLKAGSNTDVTLFLSGKTIDIDGKTYKLGGTILASGGNTSIGLPFVPKTAGSAVSTETTASNTSSATTLQKNDQGSVSTSPDQLGASATDTATTDLVNTAMTGVATIQNQDDVSNYISDILSTDHNVTDASASSDAVNLDYKTSASLFGFIPVTVPAHVSVSKDKTVNVTYPWYSFLMSTNKQAVQDAVSQAVSSTTDTTNTSDGFSARVQATITDNILSAFKNLF
jgi:hypothetical protein